MSDFRSKVDRVGAEAMQGLPWYPIDFEVPHGGPRPGIAHSGRLFYQRTGNDDLLILKFFFFDAFGYCGRQIKDTGLVRN